MIKFPHIDQFYQVARYVKTTNENPDASDQYKIKTPVKFLGTLKLHGSNAGVTITDSEFIPQSRSQVISPEKDNHGFAQFALDRSEKIRHIHEDICFAFDLPPKAQITIFGEWIGPGINKGCAIHQLPKKQWVIFGAKLKEYEDVKGGFLDLRNIEISASKENIYDIFDCQKFWKLEIDFSSLESQSIAVEKAVQFTQEVEAECPWGKMHGISGIGEGIVWVPTDEHWGNTNLFWKSKGEKHSVTKKKTLKPMLSPEVFNAISEFVDFAVTENRLTQGLEAIKEKGHPIEMKSMGHYLKWLNQDIQRECALELEDNKLDWKKVNKAVSEKARKFFMAEATKLG